MANKIVNKSVEGVDDLLENLESTAKTYLNLEKIIPSVLDLLVDQTKEIRNLNKELGTGSELTAKLKAQIAGVSASIGVNTRDTVELLNVTKKYHQGINDTTAATLKFIKASGASVDIVGNLASKMNILGNVSEETLTNTYENLLAVRDAYGLTNEEVDDIVDVVSRYAVVTQASNEQIEKGTTILAKFTSQLTSAGMEANRVSSLINDMLDPDRMTDNLVLMNKLGVSINDMVSGDPVSKLEGSTEKLKQLGQEITNIAKTNRIQANEVAKVYGLTLEEATMLSNLDTSEKALNTQKKLDQYRNEMANFSESIRAFKDKMVGIISGPLAVFGGILEKLGNALNIFGRGAAGLLTVFFVNKLLGWIRKGLNNIVGEAARKFSKEMAGYLSQAEGRLANKTAEAAGLAPRMKKGKMDYGWGKNLKASAEAKRDEYNLVSGRVGKGAGNYSLGELVEIAEGFRKQVNEVQKYGSQLNPNSREYQIWDEVYGARIKDFNDKFGSLMNSISEKMAWVNDDIKTQMELFKDESWAKQTSKGKADDINALSKILEQSGINASKFGLMEDMNKTAELASISEGPADFMEKLIEFWKLSDNPRSAEYMENVTKQLTNFKNKAVETTTTVSELREVVKEANVVLNDSKRGVKGRLHDLFGGFVTNVGTFFMKNLKKVIGVGFGLGGIGIGAALISKFTKSLQENTEYQKASASVSETISTTFSDLVTSLEPAITSIANFINAIFKKFEGPIKWITKWVGKAANSIGDGLNKITGNIANSVSTIEDSYKQEDLKTMMLMEGKYNAVTDSIEAKFDGLIEGVSKIIKQQQEGNDIATVTAAAMTSTGSN